MSLFWKIFAWFWSTMVVIGAAVFYVVTATQTEPLPQSWREATASSLAVYASMAVKAQEKNSGALPATLRGLRRQDGERFWLYDGAAHPIAGGPRDEKPLEPPVQTGGDEAPRAGEIGPGIGPMPRGIAARLTGLVQKALADEGGAAQFQLQGPMVLVAQRAVGKSGALYALGGEVRRPAAEHSLAPVHVLALALVPVMLLGTLLCYALTRHLVAPVLELRSAAQRLASGDFSARSRSVWRDDMGELSRDFNLMASQIETLIAAQNRLMGDVSHELRSPLTRLSVALAIARHYETHPEAHLALERIGEEAARLNALIGQVLQIAHLESRADGASQGLSAAQVTEIDLSWLVQSIVADAHFEAQSVGREVRAQCPEFCSFAGNEALLGSAIENIVRNAVRHTREGTAVEVTLTQQSGSDAPDFLGANAAVLRVRDHGEGVPEAELSEIFQPFYRVESARDRDSGGAGLGLAIAERAVRAHGGLIRAFNAEGGGLTVEIALPLPVQ